METSDGLHLVGHVGDADGNGSYSSNDALLISRAALQVDTGFAAYPLVDPVIVADTDGAGFIPSDAALQVNEAGVGFPTANLGNPPIPAGVHIQLAAMAIRPSISMPASLTLTSAPSTSSQGGSGVAQIAAPAQGEAPLDAAQTLARSAPPATALAHTRYPQPPIDPAGLDAFFALQLDLEGEESGRFILNL